MAAARTDPNPVMTSAMDVLDALRQRGYEPRDDAALGEGWFDRCLGDATLRVILTDDEVHLCAFDKYMALEWDARFPCGCPAAVILAALSAAEHDAGGHDTQPARKRGRYIMTIQPVIPGQFAPAKLCDPCFEDVTSMVAQVCRDRAGLCSEQAEEPCSRCGETADRLTVWQPENDTEAAACQPVTFELTYWVPTHYRAELNAAAVARKLRDRGRDDAAAIAGKIARGEITGGDATDEYADEAAPNGPALHELAYAISKEAIDLGVAGPNGEADDWDSAETYHVYAPGEHGTLEGQ